MSPRASFGLSSLIHPENEREFFRDYWLRRPHVSRGPLARFGALASIPELADIARLCRSAPYPIAALRKGGGHESPRSFAEAMRLYRAGRTLYLIGVDGWLAPLARLSARLASDLGVHARHVTCDAFASRRASGTGLHFDADVNFTIQLRGSKTWRLAPNASVEEPLDGYVAGRPVPADLFPRGRLPSKMPRGASTVVLRAGSALCFPAGYWHQTEAGDESFSIAFAVRPPSWRDLAAEALRARMTREPGWRARAFGLAGGRASERELSRMWRALRPRLRRLAARLELRDLLAAMGGPESR